MFAVLLLTSQAASSSERDRRLEKTSLAKRWMDPSKRPTDKNERSQAILYSLTNLAEIIDSLATRNEVEYEIGDHLHRVMSTVDQKDRELKRRFQSLETESHLLRAEIDDVVNQTRIELSNFMRQVRKDVVGVLSEKVKGTLGQQRLKAANIQADAASTIGQMNQSSNNTMLVFFIGLQLLIGVCLYLTWKYNKVAV